ncbi:MAG: hypothetical protein ABSB18_07275 [Candidatus Omnitrophota bacterium]
MLTNFAKDRIYIVILLAFIISISILFGNLYIYAILLGLFLSIFAFLNPRIAFWFILINVYILSSLVSVYFPFIGKKILWVTDLILVTLAFRVCVDIAMHKVSRKGSKIDIFLFVLIFLCIVSSIVNRVSLTVFLCGLRNYFKYIPLFFVARFYLNNKKSLTGLFRFLILVAVLNVPVAIGQFFLYHDFDAVGGLFSLGGSGILTVFQLLMVGYLLIIAENGIIAKWKAIALSLLLFVPIFINQTKVVFFLFPILLIYIYKYFLVKKPFQAFFIILLGIFLLFSLVSIYSAIVPGFYIKDLFSRDWLYQYLYKDSYNLNVGGLNRLSAVTFAIASISKNAFHFLMGTGIGNASLSNIPGGMGAYYEKYFYLKIDLVFLSKILWEEGFLGTLLFFLIVFKLWRCSSLVYRRAKDSRMKSHAVFFGLLVLVLTINILYDGSFYYDAFGCMFWLLGGYFSNREQIS